MLKFGEQFAKIWPQESTHRLTEFGRNMLGECVKLEKPSLNDTTIADIINASSKFPVEFGTDTCRIQSQPEIRHDFIRNQLASAYPVIHERVLYLFMQFLEHKSKYGRLNSLLLSKGILFVDDNELHNIAICRYGAINVYNQYRNFVNKFVK